MDYLALANELLCVRANLLQVPANQQLSKMVKGELFVLNYLDSHQQIIHPKELSEKLSVSTARIASLLNHMEEKNLIRRSSDPDDCRQIIVQLTDPGREMIRRVRGEALFCVSNMLESLGPEDAEEYIRIHNKIWNNFLQSK